jgi:hypothetical protein
MKHFVSSKTVTALAMSFLISPVPQAFAAELSHRPQMISTAEVLRRQNVQAQKKIITDFMMREEVRTALEKNGVSHEEAETRLAALSDEEVQRLSTQVKEARAGGDVLTTIVLVLLIIFLIQRI